MDCHVLFIQSAVRVKCTSVCALAVCSVAHRSLLPSLLSPTEVAAASASVVFSNLLNARSFTACGAEGDEPERSWRQTCDPALHIATCMAYTAPSFDCSRPHLLSGWQVGKLIVQILHVIEPSLILSEA